MNQTISFHLHVKNNVLPKLKDEKQKDMFTDMSIFAERIGTMSYSMLPSEFVYSQKKWIEIQEENEVKDAYQVTAVYSEQQWLDFLSYPTVAKYLETEVLKMNAVVLRQKLVNLSQATGITQADMKFLELLKQVVDKANDIESDIIHISRFYPRRYNDNTDRESEEYKAEAEALKAIIGYLSIDTDFMDVLDIKKANEKVEKQAQIRRENTKAKENPKAVIDKITKDQFGGIFGD